jgi:hypothetical protein
MRIAVPDRAGADIGDDFHVAVRVRGEARLRRNGIVVPDAQRAPAHPLRIVIIGEGEVVTGIEPAVVGVAQRVEFANVDHGLVLSLIAAPVSLRADAVRLLRPR